MKLSELSSKDVINDHDGSKIGRIIDVELDPDTGKVLSFQLQNGFRFVSAFSRNNIVDVPWQKIIKIGSDVIIVDNKSNTMKNSINWNNEIDNQNLCIIRIHRFSFFMQILKKQ